MKWYSVERHKPIKGNCYFIRGFNWECSSEKFFVAQCYDRSKANDSGGWVNENRDEFLNDYQITHFATIEPVEIEGRKTIFS